MVGTDKDHWAEMENIIELFKNKGINYPIYIMPLGSREEDQKTYEDYMIEFLGIPQDVIAKDKELVD